MEERESLSEQIEALTTRLEAIETKPTPASKKLRALLTGAEEGPGSVLRISVLGCLAAFILGWALFSGIRDYQWRSAINELRSEPGIEITGVERAGLFKKRVFGLRDPLAPQAADILAKHSIGASSVDLFLAEYHSLNTPYATERAAEENERYEGFIKEVTEAIGDYSREVREQREGDLERLQELLLEKVVPGSRENVQLQWNRDHFEAVGALYQPTLEKYRESATSLAVRGTIDTSGLIDLTSAGTSELRQLIESPNLLETDSRGEFVHLDRVARLIRDYDKLVNDANIQAPSFSILVKGPDSDDLRSQIEAVETRLSAQASLDRSRLKPASFTSTAESADSSVRLKMSNRPGE
ncbi:MAG: hypothetical protein AAF236_05605 [Verrucomicrobiota bacterium]